MTGTHAEQIPHQILKGKTSFWIVTQRPNHQQEQQGKKPGELGASEILRRWWNTKTKMHEEKRQRRLCARDCVLAARPEKT
jgi:hypothetical protein